MDTDAHAYPRHVLMTADTVGGVWTYAIELSRALSRNGVRVSLATMGAPLRDDQWDQARAVRDLEVYESKYKLEWMDSPWADVDDAGRWLLALERRLKPDLIHLNGYAHGVLSWSAPVLIVGHSCVLSWWEAVKRQPAPDQWREYARRVHAGLQAATYVVAPSQAMLDDLRRWYGPLDSSSVIFNGRSSSAFAPGEKMPIVLACARLWDEAKNMDALRSAAGEIEWPVYIAGDEQNPSGRKAQLHGLHLLGRLSERELSPWFSQAAIYALPARYEPFGLSVLEAALSGCALVLGGIVSLREIWGNAALFVNPDDPSTVAEAINTLSRDFNLRQRLSNRARQRALQLHPERMAEGYRNAYVKAASACVS